ncbi:hypothetical protein C0Q70_00656 [Pomacea canaliculata]|uniref:G-protein coupled receptors family 1 profile domain-containing protein n=1 Tax=Pomacea canaliculata TaxID=400727 RepID=A0A2T7PX89_POMCA|nr:hypothetical protein C0Q70_00656 [Pomacea canaliculata]
MSPSCTKKLRNSPNFADERHLDSTSWSQAATEENSGMCIKVSFTNMTEYSELELTRQTWQLRVAAWIYKVYMPLMTGLGITGNLLSMVVLLFGKMLKSTTFTYMTSLAVCDAAVQLLHAADFVGILLHYNLYTSATCGMLYFLFFFFLHASVLLTVTMTVERYLMIKYPLKANVFFTVRKTRFAVATTFFVSFLVNVHNFFTRGTVWDEALMMDVCTSGERPTHFSCCKNTERFFCHGDLQTNGTSRDKRLKENRHITVMMILVTLAFLVLVGPMGVVLIVEQHILLTGGGQFRREAIRLFCSPIQRKRDTPACAHTNARLSFQKRERERENFAPKYDRKF